MNSRLMRLTQHWLWMVPILLIVAGLAIRQIDRFPISVDELLSMNNAGYINGHTSIPAILSNLEANSSQHVPAYFLLLGQMSQVLGWTPPALRMIGVWFGLLTLAGIYRIGREQHSGRAGLYATMFVTGLTLYSFYYAHIRMYTLLTATTTFFIWSYLRVVQAKPPIRLSEWLSISLSTLLLLSSHIFSITLMMTIGLYHLLIVKKNRKWVQVSLAIIIGGLPLVAWLPVLLKGFQHTSTFSIVTSNALMPPEIFINMLTVYSNSLIPFLLLWVGLAIYMSWHRQKKLRLWLGWSATTLIIILIIGGVAPIMPPDRMRYTFVLIIPLSVAFGIWLVGYRYHMGVALVVFGVWFGGDLWMRRTYDMATYLGGRINIYDMPRLDQLAPIIAVATDADTLILSFSNHRDVTLPVRHGNTIQDFYYDSINRDHYSIFLPQEELKSDDDIQTDLVSSLDSWSKLVLITENRHEPSRRIRTVYDEILSEKFQQCETLDLTNRVTLTYYVLLDVGCD